LPLFVFRCIRLDKEVCLFETSKNLDFFEYKLGRKKEVLERR